MGMHRRLDCRWVLRRIGAYFDHTKIKRGCTMLIAFEFVSDMELCIYGVMERSPSLGAIDRLAATHSYE